LLVEECAIPICHDGTGGTKDQRAVRERACGRQNPSARHYRRLKSVGRSAAGPSIACTACWADSMLKPFSCFRRQRGSWPVGHVLPRTRLVARLHPGVAYSGEWLVNRAPRSHVSSAYQPFEPKKCHADGFPRAHRSSARCCPTSRARREQGTVPQPAGSFITGYVTCPHRRMRWLASLCG
jgi:hypothetical protein